MKSPPAPALCECVLRCLYHSLSSTVGCWLPRGAWEAVSDSSSVCSGIWFSWSWCSSPQAKKLFSLCLPAGDYPTAISSITVSPLWCRALLLYHLILFFLLCQFPHGSFELSFRFGASSSYCFTESRYFFLEKLICHFCFLSHIVFKSKSNSVVIRSENRLKLIYSVIRDFYPSAQGLKLSLIQRLQS